MKTIIVGILVLLSSVAQAQWGVGVNMGNNCPQNYGPASGAQSTNDAMSNLKGQVNEASRELALERQRLAQIKKLIAQDEKAIRAVLPNSTFQAIKAHYNHTAKPSDYRPACGTPPASVGDTTSNVVNTEPGQMNASGTSNAGAAFAPPENSCVNAQDYWQKFVEDEGKVSPDICDDNFGGTNRKNVSDSKRRACRRGMESFYEDMQVKNDIETRIDQLQADIDQYNSDFEREKFDLARGDRTTDAGLCKTGYCGDGYKSSSTLNFISSILPVAIMAGASIYNTNQQQKLEKRAINRTTQLGFPVFGPQYNMIRQNLSGGGGGGWGANPYPGSMPGYAGAFNGMYGAAPGIMGQGAFGCAGNGFNSMGMNGSMGGPSTLPYPGPGGGGAFGNPFMQNPMMGGMTPGMMNGGGPWGTPGSQGFDPYAGLNQGMFQNPYAQYPNSGWGNNGWGGGGPAMLPFPGPGGNTWGQQNPWGSPWGNNSWGQNPWGGGGPAMLPYPGPGGVAGGQGQWGNPWGGGQGYPYYGGVGGGQGYPYYSGGGNGSYGQILGSLSYDLYNMNVKVNMLQGGGGFGSPTYPVPNTGGYYTNPMWGAPVNNGGGTALPGVPSVPSR